ncbi:MAG: hypothetical protein ACLPVY_21555 [Acidimicrobiia bacterium]
MTDFNDRRWSFGLPRPPDPSQRPHATLKWIVVVAAIVIGVVVGSYLLIDQLGISIFCSYATRGADCFTVTSTR